MGTLENSNFFSGKSGVFSNPRGVKTEGRSPTSSEPESEGFQSISGDQNTTFPTDAPADRRNRYLDESGAPDHWKIVGDWMGTVGDMLGDMHATFIELEAAHEETQRRIDAAKKTTEELRARIDGIGETLPPDTLEEFRKLRDIVEVLSDQLDANEREVFRLGDIVEPDGEENNEAAI
jgi:hypothetical protein